VRFTVSGCTTKKTSSRIVHLGKPCARCHRGETARVLPAERFVAWERGAVPILKDAWDKVVAHLPRVACKRCNGSGEKSGDARRVCIGCYGSGARPPGVAGLVYVSALFFREADIGDSAGYYQAAGDALETAGVLTNDKVIKHWDGSRLLVDRKSPRVEIDVFGLDGNPDLRSLIHAAPQQLTLT
jgi:hypothetical protein